jgi:hypothetical protein
MEILYPTANIILIQLRINIILGWCPVLALYKL